MHLHVLGICGTFMGSLAQLAKSSGHTVTGADTSVYPPMSTQLEQAGIELIEGFSADQLALKPDVYVIGNVVSRGNPLMEAILNAGCDYVSGPQWLSDHILGGRWTLAVAGTHGKTSTASMLAWILEYAGMSPGYLIGGVPANFGRSASLGASDFFVIEADEYDTAFFDKRSKFLHYHPNTLVINNLEYDHADIFPDLEAIQRQFHHLLRTVPQNGMVIYPENYASIEDVIAMGCWSEEQLSAAKCSEGEAKLEQQSKAVWQYRAVAANGSVFEVFFESSNEPVGCIHWNLSGDHNMSNAVSAIAAARHVGVVPNLACEALSRFQGVKRRMELLGEVAGVKVYDDFAHHPTAIETTLAGLRASAGSDPIIAVIEPRSNTMKQGVHSTKLLESVALADRCFWFEPEGLDWSLSALFDHCEQSQVLTTTEAIITAVVSAVEAQRRTGHTPMNVVVMSNGSFEGIHKRLLAALEAARASSVG